MTKKALIIGGSSGLGLEIARLLQKEYEVVITGRRDPRIPDLNFQSLELNSDSLAALLDMFVADLPEIDLVVYAAGFFQEGNISDLSDVDIENMNRVGLLAPAMLLQRILSKQTKLSGLIAITSTSQWTPRHLEPMYTAVKAGLGMLANSISLDRRVEKVLVLGPAGMRTRFWKEDGCDTSNMLDPAWVATETMKLWAEDFKYKFARALRNPARVEVVETR
ncbi:MAG TPA: SDR family oxidoreductase [Candidatus Paceibacterota bacterium]|nr:SDR family oxidoreductase [Candidatus Paceibacterota bacterium]